MSNRARITEHSPSACDLTFTDESGVRRVREFFAPRGGGYVQESWLDPRQVCEGLSGTGHTLVWRPSTDTTLADLIRRERRRQLRRHRRHGFR